MYTNPAYICIIYSYIFAKYSPRLSALYAKEKEASASQELRRVSQTSNHLVVFINKAVYNYNKSYIDQK